MEMVHAQLLAPECNNLRLETKGEAAVADKYTLKPQFMLTPHTHPRDP
jgi:hypothetical protein